MLTIWRGFGAVVLCTAVMAFAAAPASAVITRLPSGHYLSYMRIARATRAAAQARTCATCDSIRHSLDYGGGSVMPSSTNYVVAWIPQGYTGAPFQDLGGAGYQGDPGLNSASCDGDICGYMYGVAQYFKDLAAAGVAQDMSNSNSVATQYNDGFGHIAAYNVQVAAPGNGPNGVYLAVAHRRHGRARATPVNVTLVYR